MGFTTLGLSDLVLQGVRASGYTTPTPIQAQAIKPAAEGRDIVGCAQTGTGKTAAFVLPMLHRLAASNGTGRQQLPRALVLAPTRELAQQVQDAVVTYGKFLHLTALSIYGGVGMEPQIKHLRRGVDIVIATPGRLLDHLQRRTIDLSRVEIFVLDEADRMLGMGFIDDVRKIVAKIPRERQTMLFSATVSADVSRLAASILRNPESFEVGKQHKPLETIRQKFYSAQAPSKMDLLHHVLDAEKMESVLVFARTKRGADKISQRLERSGVASIAIHSDRSQPQRQRALDGFKQGKYRVLVATDIAARGIDVDGISHVINYDVPRDAEDYVHRIGRTGRAGASGDAFTFVSGEDRDAMRRIERFTGRRYQIEPYAGFTPPERPVQAPHTSKPTVHAHRPGEHAKHSAHSGQARHSGHAKQSAHSGHVGHSGNSGNANHSEQSGQAGHSGHSGHKGQGGHSHTSGNSASPGSPEYRSKGPRKFGQKKGLKSKFRFKFGKKKKPAKAMGTFSSDAQNW